jgi:hypothetical protein
MLPSSETFTFCSFTQAPWMFDLGCLADAVPYGVLEAVCRGGGDLDHLGDGHGRPFRWKPLIAIVDRD